MGLLKKAFKWALLFLIFILVFSLVKNVLKAKDAAFKIAESKRKVEELKKENDELGKKIDSVESAFFLEKQARDKLGLAKEGEMVIILPDAETLKKAFPNKEEAKEDLPLPNWKKWLKLFY